MSWTKRIARWVGTGVVVLAIVWLSFLGVVYRKMTASPEKFGAFMEKMPPPLYLALPFQTLWFQARAGTVRVGDMAPDFSLNALDGSGAVKLSSFRGSKPVVLIFGSYT